MEQLSNKAVTRLAVGINDSTTSVVVDSVAGFPTSGVFRIVIEDEILKVTSVSGHTFTVVRGDQSTTAAGHTIDTPVAHVLTRDGYYEYLLQDIPFFNDTVVDRMFTLEDQAGNQLTSSDFTWLNQGTATVTDNADGSISLKAPGNVSAGQARWLYKAAPAGAFTLEVGGIPTLHRYNDVNNTCFVGCGFRDSSTSQLFSVIATVNYTGVGGWGDRYSVYEHSDEFTFVNTPTGGHDEGYQVGRNLQFFKIVYDGSDDMDFYHSIDGFNYRFIWNWSGVTESFTPDGIHFVCGAGNHATASNQFDTYWTISQWRES